MGIWVLFLEALLTGVTIGYYPPRTATCGRCPRCNYPPTAGGRSAPPTAERERRSVGPEDASWLMHSCGSTAVKGWSWPNFWANLASFSLGQAGTCSHRS
jgi:hypothetical protein